ncbi:TPA: hypothetical protein ACHKMM_004925 [Escherichia coli]|uniref:hypothetical protein n=1 Tax=Escherichia coli TaxID=562 RepID=UPI000AA3432D|nr:hypothetical protein [Escherichia coli]MCQ1744238.1 hypothetical protein [Escherichia coli]MEB8253690.1 hypothetical protein [Escherichia coli]
MMQKGLLYKNEEISFVDGYELIPERRFPVLLEATTLSEMELADYCQIMSSFVEQVKELRAISIQAHEMKESRCADKELRKARIRLRKLEKELLRKDKAQAEAAVLLMLREKFNVLWNTVGKSDISS